VSKLTNRSLLVAKTELRQCPPPKKSFFFSSMNFFKDSIIVTKVSYTGTCEQNETSRYKLASRLIFSVIGAFYLSAFFSLLLAGASAFLVSYVYLKPQKVGSLFTAVHVIENFHYACFFLSQLGSSSSVRSTAGSNVSSEKYYHIYWAN